jgi:O-acetyl-ADP-ribose deacetylase (regulator of RNase III)
MLAMKIKIILADISKAMTDAWAEHFFEKGPLPGIDLKIHNGSVFDTPCDAIISPANSFGFMGGGLDGILSKYLGWQVQTRVQEKIKNDFDGELLIGQSLIVPTDNEDFSS